MISTHTPLTGCNIIFDLILVGITTFLLTHPSRGATKTIGSLKKKIIFLLTHPSRGATIRTPLSAQWLTHFYSHTPHGVQPAYMTNFFKKMLFLLTHPSRGATHYYFCNAAQTFISTHTPLTGCNGKFRVPDTNASNFYSHTPHGVQLNARPQHLLDILFLLTHPSRGATDW